MHKRRLSRRKRFLEGGQEYEIVGRGQYNRENDCWGRTREERKIFLWEGGKIVEEEIVDKEARQWKKRSFQIWGGGGLWAENMKRKGKVDTKKKSRGYVATLSSRASPFVVCLWHFLSALVLRKRFLERVGVGLNLQISIQWQRKDLRGWKGERDVCFRDKFSLHKTLVHTLQLVEHVLEPFEVDWPSKPSSTCCACFGTFWGWPTFKAVLTTRMWCGGVCCLRVWWYAFLFTNFFP